MSLNLYEKKDTLQCLSLLFISLILFNFSEYLVTPFDSFVEQYTLLKTSNKSIGDWILLAVIYDFIYYWIHRFEHRVSFIWDHSHIHHHSSRHMNFLTGFRASYFQPLYSIPFLIPLYLIGFKTPEILQMVTLNKFYNFWVHQQYIKKLPILDSVLVTPANHRVHHGRNKQYINKNYGGVLIIWDKFFGTYEPENEKVLFGLEFNAEDLSLKDYFTAFVFSKK